MFPRMKPILAEAETESAVGPSPPRLDFTHVNAWIFDLDNTLYPHGSKVLLEAEQRICLYIQSLFGLTREEAWRLQKDCLAAEGATLSGLVKRFQIDPEPYLAFVNDVDVTTLKPAPRLRQALDRLPGKRIVFTNNCANYAGRVLKQLGIAGVFDAVCDIRHIGFHAKPARASYEKVIAQTGAAARESAMFEDSERNLHPAYDLGMTTVWLGRPEDAPRARPAHVHHYTDDLTHFLHAIEVRTA
jgi:putative hydrolase of the HAD superfamily